MSEASLPELEIRDSALEEPQAFFEVSEEDGNPNCSHNAKISGQKILKSMHHTDESNSSISKTEEPFFYVPVADDELDNLQRKYGELSGEIVIVEITAKDILDMVASSTDLGCQTSPLSHSTVARGSPNSPTTSFQMSPHATSPDTPKSLGISLCGNRDLNQMAVLVCGLRPGSIAEMDGRIFVGDQLLELNEHVLYGRSHLNAGPLIRSCLLSILKSSSSSKRSKAPKSLCFVICRNPENLASMAVLPLSYVNTSPTTSRKSSTETATSRKLPPTTIRGSLVGRSTFEEIHACQLLRGRNGFGFAIMDKSFTNEPGIYIKQLVENGPAALDGTLRAGDRILRVDWHDAFHASYDSVLEWIRSARHQVKLDSDFIGTQCQFH